MLNLSAGAKALVDGQTHRHATLWRIRRLDGITFRFTDHDRRVVFNGETYVPAGGIDVAARRQQRGLNPTNTEGFGPITSDQITVDDLRKGRWRDAEIEEFLVDWMFPHTYIRRVRYWMSKQEWTGETWRTEVDGVARWLLAKQGGVHTRNCRHQLGRGAITGIGCRVDVPSLRRFNLAATVVTQRLSFTVPVGNGFGQVPSAHTRNRYRFGRVIWETGANEGFVQEIMDFDQIAVNGIECFFPTPHDITNGDKLTLEPGCDKIRPTCITEYNNLVDFGGFPFMPGTNAMLAKGRGTARTPSGGGGDGGWSST